MPGSGKSTVGRQLARKLGVGFVDTDQVIEMRIGCSIRDFFEREGEAAFRDIALAAMAMKTLAAPMLKRFGYRQVLIVNTLLVACAIASYALVGAGTPLVVIVFMVL